MTFAGQVVFYEEGGLGLPSALHIARSGYLGSMALTAKTVDYTLKYCFVDTEMPELLQYEGLEEDFRLWHEDRCLSVLEKWPNTSLPKSPFPVCQPLLERRESSRRNYQGYSTGKCNR